MHVYSSKNRAMARKYIDAKAPIPWPPDVKSRLTGKDQDAGRDGRAGGEGVTEDEMVGWHCRLSGHEFE